MIHKVKSSLLFFFLPVFSFASLSEAFDSTIPVLDMNDYFSPESQEQFILEMKSALQEVGFFAVLNTGVDQETLDQAYQAAEDFFRLDSEKKLALFNPALNGQRGYVPGESAKGQKGGDFKEFYHVGRELPKERLEALKCAQNIWPVDQNLKDPLYSLYQALETYMIPLEEAMALAIGQPKDLFTEMTAEGDVLLRAIHYPANPPQDRFWAAEHTDIDLYTILPRATAEGLQMKNKAGDWIDVKVPENAFIINAGDMLENITNGEVRSGPHRVVDKNTGNERFSMVLFVHPKNQDRLDPLAESIARTGGVRKYANATRFELLEERLVDLGLASPAMMKDLSENGLMERLIEVGRASTKAMVKLRDAGLASEAVQKELERQGIHSSTVPTKS